MAAGLGARATAGRFRDGRRVIERNAGRPSAGAEGEVVLTPKAKAELAWKVQDSHDPFKGLPVRRVYIPKPGGKQRPPGIRVIHGPRAPAADRRAGR